MRFTDPKGNLSRFSDLMRDFEVYGSHGEFSVVHRSDEEFSEVHGSDEEFSEVHRSDEGF